MQERNGNLVSIRMKPTKMRAKSALITVQRRDGQALPTNRQSARLVTHLSEEMSRLWNSGYPLLRIGRFLKKTYKHDPAFQQLIEKLHSQTE